MHQTIAARDCVNKTILEMTRFAVVGGVSFIVDFGLLIVFQELIFKSVECGVLVSTALSFLISLGIHYFLAAHWVFREHNVSSARRHFVAGSLFFVTNAVGLGVNELAMWVGVSILAWHYLIVKLIATGVVMVWNYGCQKLFVFRR